MASKLKRTIYTHSGVRISPMIDDTLPAANLQAWWVDRGWLNGSVNAGPTAVPIGTYQINSQQGYVQPRTVQNATFTLNIPRADVNVFGVLGVVDRPQLEAETATLEFSFIPEKQTGGIFKGGADTQQVLFAGDINALVGDAVAQDPFYVDVWADGVGRIKTALMNSMSTEATIGALPTMTMGFTGRTHNYANLDAASVDETGDILPPDAGAFMDDVNAPYEGPLKPTKAGCFAEVDGAGDPLCPTLAENIEVDLVEPQDINLAVDSTALGTPEQLDSLQLDPPIAHGAAGSNVNRDLINEPPEKQSASGVYDWQDTGIPGESVQNPDVDTGIQTGCAQSASMSWDLPVETLLCLGANPKFDGHTLGNPPGTASFTVEALSLQLERNINAQNYILLVGSYGFSLTNGAIDSRTHNLAVGDLFGSYNYVIGGTADGFAVV